MNESRFEKRQVGERQFEEKKIKEKQMIEEQALIKEKSLTEKQLKEKLTEIKNNDWNLSSGDDARELALTAMSCIGVKDPELRDDLILTFLYDLITERKLDKTTIRELLDMCLSDDHLFYKIGAQNDESVFNRSFTVLIVRWIVSYHNKSGHNKFGHNKSGDDLLSEAEMMHVYNETLRYVRCEKDLRGYVEDGGWAHALAHGATTLRTLALSSYIQKDQLLELLDLVKEKVNVSHTVYITEESERLVMVVINIMSRGILTEDELIKWISGFSTLNEPTSIHETLYWKENLFGFLRALYFRLKYKNGSINILNEIEKTDNELNRLHNEMIE